MLLTQNNRLLLKLSLSHLHDREHGRKSVTVKPHRTILKIVVSVAATALSVTMLRGLSPFSPRLSLCIM